MAEYLLRPRLSRILRGSGSGHRAGFPGQRGALRGLRADQGALRVHPAGPHRLLFQDIAAGEVVYVCMHVPIEVSWIGSLRKDMMYE